MPFQTDHSFLQYEFTQGRQAGELWNVFPKICQGITCGCTIVTLELTPLSLSADGKDSMRQFAVDIWTRKLDRQKKSCDFDFGQMFVEELAESDWEALEAVFQQFKNECYEAADLVAEDFDFCWDEIEYDGLLVCYNDVFPFHNRIFFDAGGHSWQAFDGHCLRPECPCRETIVGICLVTPGLDGKQGEARELFSVEIDVDNGKWKVGRQYDKSPVPPATVVTALLEEIPLSLLRERHETVRAMYRRHRPVEYSPASAVVRDTPKIGRNEPCPCGSGKKYKKCCGR